MSEAPTARIILPSLLAGPTFLLFLAAASFAATIPHPLIIDWHAIGPVALMIPLSIMFGFVPALIANGIGSLLMISIGQSFPLLRFPFLWPVVGGAATWAVTKSMDLPADWVFAFIGSGAVSAMICRMRLA